MSIELESVKAINSLKQGIEATTGETYTDLTEAVQAMKDGYGQGGGTDEIESIIDQSGVLDSTDGSVTEKVEKVLDYANFKNIIQEALYNLEGSSAYNQLSVFYKTGVEDVSMFDFSKVKYFSMAFGETKIKELDIDLSSAISINQLCMSAKELKIVVFRNMTTKTTGMYQTFTGCENLEYIETLNIGGCTDNIYGVGQAFDENKALKEIRFVENCIKVSISFGHSPLLSAESIQSIIDGLATVDTTRTLYFNTNVTLQLTDKQYEQIANKNWNIG